MFHLLYTCPSPKKSIFLYRLERSSILFVLFLRAVWRLGTNKIIVSPDSSRADGTEQDLGALEHPGLALRRERFPGIYYTCPSPIILLHVDCTVVIINGLLSLVLIICP